MRSAAWAAEAPERKGNSDAVMGKERQLGSSKILASLNSCWSAARTQLQATRDRPDGLLCSEEALPLPLSSKEGLTWALPLCLGSFVPEQVSW